MPVYEYRCRRCGKRSNKLFRSYSAVKEFPCPHCGKPALVRLISKAAVLRGSSGDAGGDTGDGFGDDFGGDFDEDDPRAVARMARGMAQQMGEDLPAGYDELLGRMEGGDMPEDDDFAALDEGGDDDGDELT